MELNHPDKYWNAIKMNLAGRIRVLRIDLFGVNGAPLLAERLEVPVWTWLEYEDGSDHPGRRPSCDSSR